MQKAMFATFLLALACGLPATASADVVFDWSYSDGGSNVGSGMLTATEQPDGVTWIVDSISGTANGQTITGLDAIFGDADNEIFPTSPLMLDTGGLAFSVGSQSFDLYEDDGLFTPGTDFACGAVYCLLGPGTDSESSNNFADDAFVPVSFSVTVTAVPEPMTLALFGAGLAGLGTLRRRRKVA